MATNLESQDLKRKRTYFYSYNKATSESEYSSQESEEQEGDEAKTKESEYVSQDSDKREEKEGEEAKPIGDPIRSTKRKEFFNACEVNNVTYKVGDIVSLHAGEGVQSYIGEIMALPLKLSSNPEKQVKLEVRMRWFYRPEEALKKNGTTWQPEHPRELYLSNHIDDLSDAGIILKKVTIYFVPPSKPVPPIPEGAYVVRYLYDHNHKSKMLVPITDKDFAVGKLTKEHQHRIEVTSALLVSFKAPRALVPQAELDPDKVEIAKSSGLEPVQEGAEARPPAKPESAPAEAGAPQSKDQNPKSTNPEAESFT